MSRVSVQRGSESDGSRWLVAMALGVVGLFVLGVIALCAVAKPASAEPVYDVQITRDEAEFPDVHRTDERVDYTVKVANVASTNPDVGDELFCNGIESPATPEQSKNWSPGVPGDPTHPAYVFEWRRNGVVIPTETSQTYTTTPTDAGTVIQCLVKGTNATSGAKYASMPGAVINPQPSVPPPAPSERAVAGSRPTIVGTGTAVRTCIAPANWSGLARATATAGSATLTSVVTAAGTGVLDEGSSTVTDVVTTTGPFIVGQAIAGTGIPAGAMVAAVGSDTIELSAPATADGVQALSAGAQPFAVGQVIVGNGIPAGATIIAVSGQSMTLSAPANASATGVAVSSSATATWTYQWLRNGEEIGGATGSTYTPVVGVGQPDQDKVLQCMFTTTNAGGSLVGTSNNSAVGSVASQAVLPVAQNPAAEFSNTTSATVTMVLELPSGLGTFADAIDGNDGKDALSWSCSASAATVMEVAKAICTRADSLAPGGSAYDPIEVHTALGADAPDVATATATASGGGATTAVSATNQFSFAPALSFGVKAFETQVHDQFGAPYTQAGGHPFSAGLTFSLNSKRILRPPDESKPFRSIGQTKTIITDAPRGFVGNALAIKALCPGAKEVLEGTCPLESIVGGISLNFEGVFSINLPIYALEPEFGRPAQFAFTNVATNALYVFFPRLRADDGYAISFESAPIPAVFPRLLDADVRLCGFGANAIDKGDRNEFVDCRKATDANANPKPLATLPTRCEGPPPTTTLRVDSWHSPDVFTGKSFSDPSVTGCEQIKFEPEMALEPTSHRADSPTGMDVEIFMPTGGLEDKLGIAQSNLKRVTVTLPEGMAVNASAGHGLGACTAAEVGIDSDTGVPNEAEARCPDSSKIGTIGITTPLIKSTLTGDVFIAKQGKDNPFDSNVALYLVFSTKRDGITIKVAGEVKPDPATGQMQIVFDDNPEAPFSSVELHFPQGPRSPLLNPPTCGKYEIKAELTPWSAKDPDNPTTSETVEEISTYEVTEGPGGGPCPDGKLDPKLNAGTTEPVAGRTSSFVMRLQREDGTQRFTGIELSPPQGLTAYLKGVQYCSDAVLSAISPAPETGQAQIDNPSCPASSLVGSASAGAGAGDNPFYVDTGKVYLAGPYKGAPVSLALVTPAVAGPLDLGNVVIRTALYINSKTAQITAVSDPVPTILHGILLNIKDVRVAIDRPNFTLNPTSCKEMAVAAKVKGDGGGSVEVSNRFQVGDCAALGFKPRMSLSLKGGTKRGDNPALKAVVRPREGDANIGRASVTLPRSAFLDQAHIRTICTRVQFAADSCPKAAIYGRAEVITPLLDEPLKGPVYLRSSDNELPDLVADLRGPANQPIKVEAAFRTDSIKGGIRSTLDFAPDAPVTKFTLQMQGGKKGLVVNSQDICAKTNRATARMVGQNGRRYDFRPKVVATNCAKQRKGKRKSHPGGSGR